MVAPSDIILGTLHISQICIGVMGNSLLFGSYMYIFFIQPHLKKPIDPIFMHLTFLNIFTITFPSLSYVASSFGVRRFLDDVGCQALLYSSRVIRGLSIFTTSLLSAFQAIMISPMNPKWAWLKFKLSALIFPSFLFIWIFNLLLCNYIIYSVRAISNFTVVGHVYSHAYCESRKMKSEKSNSMISSLLIYDLVLLTFVICTSLYMVNLLYRHHRRAQCVRGSHLSSQASPEHKATQTILLLVGCFVFFYCSNNVVTFYSFYTHEKIPRLEGISVILSSCYPTICPFLLMRNNKIASRFMSTLSLMRIICPQRKSHG